MPIPWGGILSFAGGLLGGSGGGGSQTTTSVPWSATQPYLKNLFERADMIGRDPNYNKNAPQITAQKYIKEMQSRGGKNGGDVEVEVLNPEWTRQNKARQDYLAKGDKIHPIAPIYDKSLITPTNQHLTNFIEQATNPEGQMSADEVRAKYGDLSDDVVGTLRNFRYGGQANKTIGGGYLGGADVKGAVARAMNPIKENFREIIAPTLASVATTGGGNYYGSSDFNNLSNQANRNLSREIADTTADIAYKDYAKERSHQHDLISKKMTLDDARNARIAGSKERIGLAGVTDEVRTADDNYKRNLANLLGAGTLQQSLDEKKTKADYDEWQRTSPEYREYDEAMTKRKAEWDDINKFAQLLRGHGTQTSQYTPYSYGQKIQNFQDAAATTSDAVNAIKELWKGPARHSSWMAAPTWRPSNHPRGV